MSMEKNNLEQLLAGHRVFIDRSRYGETVLEAHRVHRVTATQIIIRDGLCADGSPRDYRFNRVSGREIGSGSDWNWNSLLVPTPEIEAKYDKLKLVARFSAMKWKDLNLAQLRAADDAIRNTKPDSPQ